MQDNEKLEDIAMQIIANSGAARGAVFGALAAARERAFEEAEALLTQANDFFHLAHAAHRELLQLDAMGEVERLSVLLTHAQDHLMTSILAEELAREILFLHQKS